MILLKAVEHLLTQVTVSYEGQYYPLVTPGVELHYRDQRFKCAVNLGDELEGYSVRLETGWMDPETAIKIVYQVGTQIGVVWSLDNEPPLLFYDAYMPRKWIAPVKNYAQQYGFKIGGPYNEK